MKKFLFSVSLVFLLTFTSIPCYAVEALDQDSIYDKIQVMLEEELGTGLQPISEGVLRNIDTGEEILVPVYELDTTALFATDNDFRTRTLVAKVSSTHNADATDRNNTLYAYSSFTYQQLSEPTRYLVTACSGYYTRYESNLVVDLTVNVGCSDLLMSQVITKHPTGSSFSYNTGFTKYAAALGGASGVTCIYKLSRNSSNWEFIFTNAYGTSVPIQ